VLFPELQKARCKSGIYGEDQELPAKLKNGGRPDISVTTKAQRNNKLPIAFIKIKYFISNFNKIASIVQKKSDHICVNRNRDNNPLSCNSQ